MPETEAHEPKIERILFATDFSATAAGAFAHALLVAQRFGAELHVLHAAVLGREGADKRSHAERGDLLRRLEDETAAALDRWADPERPRPRLLTSVRRGLYPSEVILEYAAKQSIDLAVLGTHGRRGAERLLFGSVAAEVVRQAPCAVLTRPGRRREMESPVISRILVAVDFSPPSLEALAYGVGLARAFDAHIDVLHVIEQAPLPRLRTDEAVGGWKERVKGLVKEVEGNLEKRMSTVELPWNRHVRQGRPGEAIVELAGERHSDLIILSSRGLNPVQRLFFGSTAEAMLGRAPCPVLTLRGRMPKAASSDPI